MIDEIVILNKWKEYVEKLYGKGENTDPIIINPSDCTFDSNANTGILKSEFEDAL